LCSPFSWAQFGGLCGRSNEEKFWGFLDLRTQPVRRLFLKQQTSKQQLTKMKNLLTLPHHGNDDAVGCIFLRIDYLIEEFGFTLRKKIRKCRSFSNL
jgi:hypothetical protein